ncbi:hypothetical protein BDW74DRAFT_142880 [Aspergillus multicolor]|uniref:DUF1772 domain-containing protein n=1 Tax=Aspergillus multicolor TaxID=41759 RepID=UPI003CCDECB7
MMTITFLTIPVWLDTITTPGPLLHQWLRMYHYGHLGHPTMAATTLTLYAISAYRRRSNGRPWGSLVTAGAVTMLMSAFTLLIMLPTNNVLFEHATTTSATQTIPFEEARGLVVKWGWLHLTRCIFPLLGAVIGMGDILGPSAPCLHI